MNSDPLVSIVIPTRNRAETLHDTLESIAQDYAEQSIELLIMNNGSTDRTVQVAHEFSKKVSFNCYCHTIPCPGLHVGRNLGAQLANGKLLAYLDDDVLVQKGWLAAIIERFTADRGLALLGGPCLPHWEAGPPSWVEQFRENSGGGGWVMPPWSLVEYSHEFGPIPGVFVFGCNYIIQKDIVLAAGGFHPDGMPAHMLRFRGDGETGLSAWIEKSGLTIKYDPRVCILHRVPKERLSKNYVMGIYKRNGFSAAFTQARASNGRNLYKPLMNSFIESNITILKIVKRYILKKPFLLLLALYYSQLICIFHLIKIFSSKELKQWVTQKTYFVDDPCPYWRKNGTNKNLS